MAARKVLVSTFGSAGDLFPLIPFIDRLMARGDEVTVATRRGLGLYLRAHGVRTVGLGDGSELRVVHDPRIFSTRFDGWESWHRTVDRYVAATLEADAATVRSVIESWEPDAVVTSGFATAARLAALEAKVPQVEVSIYPQHVRLGASNVRFARRFRRVAEQVAGRELSTADGARVVWGAPPDVLLHDPVLLGSEPSVGARPVGFPYWDTIPGTAGDEGAVRAFVSAGGPVVFVTLGSFIGVATSEVWLDAARVVAALGVRAVFVGARGRWADEHLGDCRDILCSGFVPLSEHLPGAAAIVHHGGIGTTFGAIHAGVPAVVLAQAFDQPFNSRLVAAAGVGVASSRDSLETDLRTVLDGRAAVDTERVRSALIPPSEATASLTDLVDAAISQKRL